MKVVSIHRISGWDVVLATAKATQSKPIELREPSEAWKRKIVAAPHSPIRALQYLIQFTCEYFVQCHLVRHHEGAQWFVGSQRNDRQDKYDRRAARQDTEVTVTCLINGDALKFISRRRLCGMASPETRAVWKGIIDAVCEIDPILKPYLVPECVASGFCPEFNPCGYCGTEAWKQRVANYRSR